MSPPLEVADPDAIGVGGVSVAVEGDAEGGIEERDEGDEEKDRKEGTKADRRVGRLEVINVRCMSI